MSCAREQSPPSSAHALPHGPRKVKAKGAVVSDSLRPRGLYSPWNAPGQNSGVGSLSLLQGIFPTQGRNPGLLHCRRILYQLSHKGSPRILAWVGYPFSRWIMELGTAQCLPTQGPRLEPRCCCIPLWGLDWRGGVVSRLTQGPVTASQ